MKFFTKKRIVAAVGTAVLIGSGTAAYALWSATGSGSGAATAYTAQASVASNPATGPAADTNLWPGDGTGTDLHFNITNPNPYPVQFTGWSTAAVSAVSGGLGTCATGDFTVTASGSNTINVPANTTTQAATIPGALFMKSTVSGSDCQGASVTVTFTLTGGAQTT